MREPYPMIAKITGITLLSAFMFFPSYSTGQNTDTPANPGERFQIERDGDGFVRLDTKTGETSFCRRANNNLVCKLAIEERDTFHDEITGLQKKLSAAEEKLNAIGEDKQALVRPKDDVPDTNHDEDAGSGNDKFEQELDRAMDITKMTMRRLFAIVKDLQKEYGDEY